MSTGRQFHLVVVDSCRRVYGVVLAVHRYHQSRVKRLEWQVDGCPRRMSEEEVRAAADEHGAHCRRISITRPPRWAGSSRVRRECEWVSVADVKLGEYAGKSLAIGWGSSIDAFRLFLLTLDPWACARHFVGRVPERSACLRVSRVISQTALFCDSRWSY